jgi:hypothetical protein
LIIGGENETRCFDWFVYVAGLLFWLHKKKKLFSNPDQEQTLKYLNEEYCDCE